MRENSIHDYFLYSLLISILAMGLPSRHQSIRDLLHFHSRQKQAFRPNVREENRIRNKVWYQINKPSYVKK